MQSEPKLSTAPLVSVVVPAFNGAQYLAASLDTILAQTYPRLEVLLMDDASTDTTPSIAAGYGDRIRHVRQSKNRGIYGNTNDGIALAQGEYIAVYHADDLYDPRIVERQVAFLQRYPEAGAVFAADIFINAAGTELGRLTLKPELRGERPLDFKAIFNSLLRYKNRALVTPSSMVRASVYHTLGGYRDSVYRNTSDLEMWLRISRQHALGILEEHLLSYRKGHENSSGRYQRLRQEPERFFLIMDECLAQGARAIAEPDALAAYEAHRAEDLLMVCINHYILAHPREAALFAGRASARAIGSSSQVQRFRLLVLLGLMRMLVHLPRVRWLADLFYWRWQVRGVRKPRPVSQVNGAPQKA